MHEKTKRQTWRKGGRNKGGRKARDMSETCHRSQDPLPCATCRGLRAEAVAHEYHYIIIRTEVSVSVLKIETGRQTDRRGGRTYVKQCASTE